MKQRTVPAAQFKNSCLKLMEDVRKHRTSITVTKRGKPLVRVIPISEPPRRASLIGTIIYEADDIFSTGESWDADR